jgi:hypothetical protein
LTAEQILSRLKDLAPDVAFSVVSEPLPDYVWDGDGPDPIEDGLMPHEVVVSARAVENAALIEDDKACYGHYLKEGESPGDVGGYLPQMLKDAASYLLKRLTDGRLKGQVRAVIEFLRVEMRERWEEEQRGKK